MGTLTRSLVGVNFDGVDASPADRDAVYGALNGTAGWVRLGASWYGVEPVAGVQSPTALAALDACIAAATDAGLKVLVVYGGSPTWATPQGGAWHTPPSRPAFYARSVAQLAARYPQVAAWEIWDEANTARQWTGTVPEYVALLRSAAKAIRAANPAARVVLSGTAHTDTAWVKAVYAAGGKGHFDVLATHPYPRIKTNTDVAQILGETNAVRRIMLDHGDDSPVWLTEFGWSRASVSPAAQAAALTASYRHIAAKLPYVGAAFWFEAKNEGTTSDTWKDGLSLLNPDGSGSLAMVALRNLT